MNKLLHFGRIPVRRFFRPHLCFLVLCALGLAVPHFQAQQTAASPGPPANLDLYKFIDPHVHAMSVTPLGLRAVAKWMEERDVERCIVSPLNHKGSRAWSEEERKQLLENFLPYKGKIDRMTIIDPGEVETVDQAIALLKREIADGAVGFGEHYGKDLMFDDPKNLMLYEACEKVGLPVMFHIDQNKNMVEPGMERVDRVLKMFPKCKVVAHAYWWRQLQHADRQLQEHPNLYADMSGHVVVQVLNRDRKYAREFLIRNQDKILWATDEGWWSFADKNKQMNQHYTFLEELDLPDEVRHKIYRGNAEKVYGLKREGDSGKPQWSDGFGKADFKIGTRKALLVMPKSPAAGKPWIWRTEFPGHQPQGDIGLLEKGFHVGYIDLQNLYGAPVAMKAMDEYHAHVTKTFGLSQKAILEGFSRGGLFAFNWAAQNPQNVAGLYVDAPVCDFKSWPGGKGKSKGSPGDWQRLLTVYGLTEEQALAYDKNPVDNLAPLAKAKIPILAVVGEADRTVPVSENIDVVEKRYRELGGEITVIRKPGVDHHPHSLKDPAPIVDFALRAVSR